MLGGVLLGIIEAGLFFIFILAGILLGLYIGLSIIDFILNSKKERKRVRKKSNKKIARITDKREKKEKNILSERIQEKNSYTQRLCESYGNNKTEFVKKARKTQDFKYCDHLKH